MHGPEDVAQRAVDWLYGRIPARLRILEERLELEPLSLPDPAQVLGHERGPLGLEDWPSVFVLPQRLTAAELVDVEDDGAEQYRNTYRVRILAWVRASGDGATDGYAATNALRNRYTLAIREALLERKSLKLPGSLVAGDPDSDLAVDPNSIREDYSPLIDDEGRTIAGVTIDVDLTVRELLPPPPPLGTADDVLVDVHPALT